VSPRTARDTQRNPVLKNKNQNKKSKSKDISDSNRIYSIKLKIPVRAGQSLDQETTAGKASSS
jgi:hypothetical protein